MIEKIRKVLREELDKQQIKAKALSREADLNTSAVRDLLKGVANPRFETLNKLADTLGIPRALLYDAEVPISGQVSAGGVVSLFVEGDPLQSVPRPPFPTSVELVALEVADNSLAPAHREGDVLFISRTSDEIKIEYFGAEVVAQLADGAGAYLRVLAGNEDGTHTLRAANFLDHERVRLAWAAPILFVTRAAGRSGFGVSKK